MELIYKGKLNYYLGQPKWQLGQKNWDRGSRSSHLDPNLSGW